MRSLRYGYEGSSPVVKLLKIFTEKVLETGARLNSPALCSLVFSSTDSEANSRALRIAAESASHDVVRYMFQKAASISDYDTDIMHPYRFSAGKEADRAYEIANNGNDPIMAKMFKDDDEYWVNRMREYREREKAYGDRIKAGIEASIKARL